MPVMPTEPLILRGNVGQKIVIDFVNQIKDEKVSLHILGMYYDKQMSVPTSKNGAPQLRYVIRIPDDARAEGTYYMHSMPVDLDREEVSSFLVNEELAAMRNQTRHGLFGGFIIEPKGAVYYDPYSYHLETQAGIDGEIDPVNYEVSGYQEIKSGWAAIIAHGSEEGEVFQAFREHTLIFHDDLPGVLTGLVESDVKAINYRTEPFSDLFDPTVKGGEIKEKNKIPADVDSIDKLDHGILPIGVKEKIEGDEHFKAVNERLPLGVPEVISIKQSDARRTSWRVDYSNRLLFIVDLELEIENDAPKEFDVFEGKRPRIAGERPFIVNDHSMGYGAYTYGDSSTPHPQFYVGDPMRYRVIHGGMGDQFHVFHHHAHRWRFQPDVERDNMVPPNETKPSKWGLKSDIDAFKHQPDLERSISTRVDSQTLGPAETFDVIMEGGAGGVQRTVGDVLLHCHIISHVTQGMWSYARIFNTLQRRTNATPGLAPLPDRLGDGARPPMAIDSVHMAKRARSPGNEPIPVSGVLAEERIDDVKGELYPYIEAHLPAKGEPQPDKKIGDDKVAINRANRWLWSSDVIKGDDWKTYFGEPYEVSPSSPSEIVHFARGFPTVGEGMGARTPDETTTIAPRLLFNPVDGRLAYPHLTPRAGRRPPFAPKKMLVRRADGTFRTERSKKHQGTPYLGPSMGNEITGRTNGEAIGVSTGSGLAPEGESG